MPKLDTLNEPMSKLPSHEIYYIRHPFFEQYPYFRHIVAISFILLIGYGVFYLGTNYLRVSIDNAYIAAIAFIGSLSAGYLGYLAINIKRGS
jgi:predicted ferric reductase